MTASTRRRFAEIMRSPEPDLGLACLLVGAEVFPDLDVAESLATLDTLAESAAPYMVAGEEAAGLRQALADDAGFRGYGDDYADLRASLLHEVLRRRRGLPILLSVVYLEVARRLGVPAYGVGLPGHFVVSAQVGTESVLLDPFDGGTVLTHETAADVVSRAVGRRVTLTEDHFAPVGKRQILARVLANLKGAYVRREEWAKSLAIVDRLLVLDGPSSVFVRDRGSLLIKLGDLLRGAAAWERYLRANPKATDADKVKRDLRRVRQRIASLN